MLVDMPLGCSTAPPLSVELRHGWVALSFTQSLPGVALDQLEVQEVSGGWALLPSVWRFII